jgi:hypothetical protein
MQPMATHADNSTLFRRHDVSFHWTGGRNATWRLTHEPTGITIEGSTQIAEERFTKKRLRIAEEQLQAQLLDELKQRVMRHLEATGETG